MKKHILPRLTGLFLALLLSFPPLFTAAHAAQPLAGQLSGFIADDGTACVLLSAAEPGLLYALRTDDGWRAPENGVLAWNGLEPAAPFELVCKPAGDADTAPAAARPGLSFYTPAPGPGPDAFCREPDFEPHMDQLTLSQTGFEFEYALTGADGRIIALRGEEWVSGGQVIRYTQLAFDEEYHILTRALCLFGDALCLASSTPVPVSHDVVFADALTASIDERGCGRNTVGSSDPGRQYAALEADGTVAALAAGTEHAAALTGLLPGFSYRVTSRGADEALTPGHRLPVRGTPAALPVVPGALGLFYGREDGGAFAELSPVCPDAAYSIVDAAGLPIDGLRAFDGSGAEVTGSAGWFSSADLLRFAPAPSSDGCRLALRRGSGSQPVFYPLPALPVGLPLPALSDARLTADSLTLSGRPGLQYALAGAKDSAPLSEWLPGGETPLFFGGLTAGRSYRLFVRGADLPPVLCFAFTPAAAGTDPAPSIPSGNPAPQPPRETAAPHAVPAGGAERLLVTERRVAYLTGDPQGLCRPEQPLTRAELCAMLYRLLRQAPDADAPYTDVAQSAWHAPYIAALTSLGIVQGTGDGRFRPDAPVTRAELAAIAGRFCLPADAALSFPDLPDGHWAFSHAAAACARGWLQTDGEGAFRPDAPVSRGQAVRLLNLLLGRAPDPEALAGAHTPPAFADLSPQSPWYYDIWEASLSA